MIRDGNVTEATEQADSLVRQAQSEIGLGLRFDTVRGLTALKAAMAEEETREAGRPTPRENGGGTGKADTGRPIPPPFQAGAPPAPRSGAVPSRLLSRTGTSTSPPVGPPGPMTPAAGVETGVRVSSGGAEISSSSSPERTAS